MTDVFCFEGIDASGKSTQIERVKLILEQKYSKRVAIIDEFSESPIGNIIEKNLEEDRYVRFKNFNTRLAEFFLLLSDFSYKIEKYIPIMEKEYSIILLDRYYYSPLAIQLSLLANFYKFDYSSSLIDALSFCKKIFPDLRHKTIYIDIPPELSFNRILFRENCALNEEEKDVLFQAHHGYKIISKTQSNFYSVDGSLPINKVTETIIRLVRNYDE